MAKLSFICILIIGVGCGYRNQSGMHHEEPITSSDPFQQDYNKEAKGDGANITTNDLNQIKLEGDVFNKLFLPLKTELIDGDLQALYRDDPEGTVKKLRTFHYLFYYLSQNKENQLSKSDVFKKYRERVLAGCDAAFTGCKNLTPLVKTHNFSDALFVLLTDRSLKVAEFFRFLRLGLDFPRDNDIRFVQLVLERFNEIEKYLAGLNNSEREFFYQRFTPHLIIFLREAQSADVQKLLAVFQIWQRDILQGTASEVQLRKTILFRAVEKGLATCEKKCTVHPDLLAEVKKDMSLPNSFANVFKGIKQYPGIIAGFAIPEKVVMDDYFVLIERVFNGYWDLDIAQSYYTAILGESAKLAQVVTAYLKVQFAATILAFNRNMQVKLFNDASLATGDLREKAELEATNLSPILVDFNQRLERLSKVITGLDHNSNQYLNKWLVGFPQSVKMLEYVQIMILFYYLSKTNNNYFNYFYLEHYDSEKNSFEKTAKSVPRHELWQRLFQGQFPPFLNLTKNKTAFSVYEILYTFDFALKSAVFEAIKVPAEEFLLHAVNEFLTKNFMYLEKEFKYLFDGFNDYATYNRFLQICRAEMNGQPHKNILNLDEISHSPFLGYWAETVYDFGRTEIIGNFMQWRRNVYRNSHVKDLERLRTQYLFDLLIGEALRDLLANHLQKCGSTEAEIKRKLGALDNKLAHFRKTANNLYEFFLIKHREFARCDTVMIRKELAVQKQLILSEINFLRKVFHEGQTQKSAVYASPELANRPQLMDRIANHGFHYHRLGFLLRMKENLAKIVPQWVIEVPDDLSLSEFFIPDLLDEHTHVIPIVRQSDESNFIREAFTYTFSQNSKLSYANWFNHYRYYFHWWDKLEMMVSLLKIGNFPQSRVVDNAIHAKSTRLSVSELVSETKEMLKTIGLDEVDRQILALLNRDNKFSLLLHAPFQDIFYQRDNHQILPLFTAIYHQATANFMGTPFSKPGSRSHVESEKESALLKAKDFPYPTLFDMANLYYQSLESKSKLIIPADASLDNFGAYFRELIGWEIKVVQDLEAAIRQEEKTNSTKPESEKLYYDYDINTRAYGPYLDPYEVKDFFGRLGALNRRTNHFFTSKSPTKSLH